MKSLTRGNLKTAIKSVRSTRWRSLMTMMGIIIGIISVVTVVSIGEGVKQQVAAESDQFSKGLLTVRPGRIVQRDDKGVITNVNLLAGYTPTGVLTSDDVHVLRSSKDIARAVPLSTVAGELSHDKRAWPGIAVIGTTPDFPIVTKQKVAYGDFFGNDDSNENGAIIGSSIAQEVFGQDVPLGQSFEFHGEQFVVRGVFEAFKTAPLTLETDFNRSVFISYQVAQEMTNDKALVFEILAQPRDGISPSVVAKSVTAKLTAAHGGQEDFTVLRQGETVYVTGHILNLLTRLIAGIAAISLLVGGIGIMNVMLVSVTERMQEIGIRKAVGASARQIMNQFLVEATVLSVVGGIIGVIISLVINLVLRILTPLEPVINWRVMVLAVVVTIGVGIVFGTAPALKAARKDPIDALRNE